MAAPELAQVIERAPYVKEPVTRDRVTGSSSWLASPASRPRNTNHRPQSCDATTIRRCVSDMNGKADPTIFAAVSDMQFSL
jgi:hypothetical protein